MKTVKVHFCDFFPTFNLKNNIYLKILRRRFDVVTTNEDPDYVICSVFAGKRSKFRKTKTFEHFRYPNAIKIMYSGENYMPDLNHCDYGIGFDHLTVGDRYLRMPNYAIYPAYQKLFEPRPTLTKEDLKGRTEFCNFTFSNSRAMPERDRFFHLLSAAKHVMSTGRHLRNSDALDILQTTKKLPGPLAKVELLKNYKFSIAFENTCHPGYTTEKLMEPFAARALPIYLGNPMVALDFNTKSFINAHDYPDLNAVVEKVIQLDNDDDTYLRMVNEDPLIPDERTANNLQNQFEGFLYRIFDQPKDATRRRAMYGFTGSKHDAQVSIATRRSSLPFWR